MESANFNKNRKIPFLKRRQHNYMISQAIKFTGINQLVKLLTGPSLLVALPLFLTSEDLGFWFSMTGLVAMIAFADFGFSSITLQFASHEFAKLRFTEDGDIVGDKECMDRLSSLFVFSIKWTGLVASISLPLVAVIGFYLLQKHVTTTSWIGVWVLLCFVSALSIVLNTVLSFLEGCDSVAKIQKIRSLMAISNSIGVLVGLFCGFGLFSIVLSSVLGVLIGSAFVYNGYSVIIRNLIYTPNALKYNWKPEIYPLLVRYSVSWLSGYAMFQLFSPIMFYYVGPVEAGKIGLSISLFTAIFTISNVWTTSHLPKFGMSIANHDFEGLLSIFSRGLKFSIIIYLTTILSLGAIYFFARHHFALFDKFLGFPSLLMLAFAWFLQLIIHNYALFLRSFKQDPLMLVSVIAAIHTVSMTILCIKYFGKDYFLLGFVSSYIWLLPWVLVLFKNKKASLSRFKVDSAAIT